MCVGIDQQVEVRVQHGLDKALYPEEVSPLRAPPGAVGFPCHPGMRPSVTHLRGELLAVTDGARRRGPLNDRRDQQVRALVPKALVRAAVLARVRHHHHDS